MGKQMQKQLDEIPPEEMKNIIGETLVLYKQEPTKTDQEFEERVAWYFDYCNKTGMRPGIESMCLALGITRTSLWRYSNGINCSQHKAEVAAKARQMVASVVEQASMRNKLSPPVGIFLMKNWMNYTDNATLTIDQGESEVQVQHVPEEIAEIFKNENQTELLETEYTETDDELLFE